MSYNYSKLIGKIIETYGTRRAFACKLGVSERTLSLKLNNKIPWDQKEIDKAISLLNLSSNDVVVYFFTQNVQYH